MTGTRLDDQVPDDAMIVKEVGIRMFTKDLFFFIGIKRAQITNKQNIFSTDNDDHLANDNDVGDHGIINTTDHPGEKVKATI